MLIPRYTIRWLLAVMAVSALLAFVVSLGVAGRVWAIAISVTIGCLILTILLSVSMFCLAWGGAATWRSLTGRRAVASPFATHSPPPQLLDPSEPD